MTLNKLLCLIFLPAIWIGCNAPTNSSSPFPQPNGPSNGSVLPTLVGDNVIPLTVNGSLCSNNSYFNKPCVAITICAPNDSTNCQTVNDILVDTGSYGFRVFKSVLNPTLSNALSPITVNGGELAQCVHFGDGSADWGPIETANLVLGNESPVGVPIQVIDSTYSNPSTACPRAEQNPSAAGLNGILGVGLFAHDCGTKCTTKSSNNLYFACSDNTCTGTKVSLENQVQNPVALLPKDNNGVIIELPTVPLGGLPAAEGYLVLGIGTAANNIPKGVRAISADPVTGDFFTSINGNSYSSFLDTGSNGLFFPGPTSVPLPDCGNLNPVLSNWFCPGSPTGFSASITSYSGSVIHSIFFQIGNMANLKNSNHFVFSEVGGNMGLNAFDWGLPFYLGRNVYVGIENSPSSLGTGPYWAY